MGSTLIDKGLLHIVLLHLARKEMWSKFPNQGVDMFGNSARLGEVKTSPWKRSLFLLTAPTPGNILFGGRGKALVKFLVFRENRCACRCPCKSEEQFYFYPCSYP